MSIEAIKAQHQQVQAQLYEVNVQIAKIAHSEIKQLAKVAGLRVEFLNRGPLVGKTRATAPKWSNEEKELLKQFYKERGAVWLKRELLKNRTLFAIRRRADELGLSGWKS